MPNDYEFRYEIAAPISNDFDLGFVIGALISNDFDLGFVIGAPISTDFRFLTTILSTKNRYKSEKSYKIVYIVYNRIKSSRKKSILFNFIEISAPISNDFDFKTQIGAPISNDFDLGFVIGSPISTIFGKKSEKS